MTKAYLDTTILAEAFLKTRIQAKVARAAIAKFGGGAEVHRYAFKEFKSGPLRNFVWMHNKLVITKSFKHSISALQRMSLTPKRYTTSTALEALERAGESLPNTLRDLVATYGEAADPDVCLADTFRLAIKAAVLKAWKQRDKLAKAVHNLPCYLEVPPFEKLGMLEIKPTDCSHGCCLETELRARKGDLISLRDAILESGQGGRENEKKTSALKQLIKKDGLALDNRVCRDLGDVIFAFFCPLDAVILTTNIRDHSILANALGKRAETPFD